MCVASSSLSSSGACVSASSVDSLSSIGPDPCGNPGGVLRSPSLRYGNCLTFWVVCSKIGTIGRESHI
jgi:hypothetical protein